MAELFKQDPYMTAAVVIGVGHHSTGCHWPLAQEEELLEDTEPAQLWSPSMKDDGTTVPQSQGDPKFLQRGTNFEENGDKKGTQNDVQGDQKFEFFKIVH